MKHFSVLQKEFYNKFYVDKRKGEHSFKTYKEVCKTFNKMVSELILNASHEFKMPISLGSIYIKQFTPKISVLDNGKLDKKHLKIDWGSTKTLRMKHFPNMTYKEICTHLKEIGETSKFVVHHYNDHTFGKVAKWVWVISSPVINKQFYKFYPTKFNKKDLVKIIKDNPNKINNYQLTNVK